MTYYARYRTNGFQNVPDDGMIPHCLRDFEFRVLGHRHRQIVHGMGLDPIVLILHEGKLKAMQLTLTPSDREFYNAVHHIAYFAKPAREKIQVSITGSPQVQDLYDIPHCIISINRIRCVAKSRNHDAEVGKVLDAYANMVDMQQALGAFDSLQKLVKSTCQKLIMIMLNANLLVYSVYRCVASGARAIRLNQPKSVSELFKLRRQSQYVGTL